MSRHGGKTQAMKESLAKEQTRRYVEGLPPLKVFYAGRKDYIDVELPKGELSEQARLQGGGGWEMSHQDHIDKAKRKGQELAQCCVGGHIPPCIKCPGCGDMIRPEDTGRECVPERKP